MSDTRKFLNIEIGPISHPFVLIDKHYTPPPQLQLNQQIRGESRRDYYANTTFIGNVDDMIPWLKSLELQDWHAMREIRCWASIPKPEHPKMEEKYKPEQETVEEQEEYARREHLWAEKFEAWGNLWKLWFDIGKVIMGTSVDEVSGVSCSLRICAD